MATLLSSTVFSTTNEWNELDLNATFENGEFQITIVGCNAEPHLYVNVFMPKSGDTYIYNDCICVGGFTSGEFVVLPKDYTAEQFKRTCDQWITDFISSMK